MIGKFYEASDNLKWFGLSKSRFQWFAYEDTTTVDAGHTIWSERCTDDGYSVSLGDPVNGDPEYDLFLTKPSQQSLPGAIVVYM